MTDVRKIRNRMFRFSIRPSVFGSSLRSKKATESVKSARSVGRSNERRDRATVKGASSSQPTNEHTFERVLARLKRRWSGKIRKNVNTGTTTPEKTPSVRSYSLFESVHWRVTSRLTRTGFLITVYMVEWLFYESGSLGSACCSARVFRWPMRP